MNSLERANRNRTIAEAYERGDHVTDIAKNLGTSKPVVYSVIRSARESGVVTRVVRSSNAEALTEKALQRKERVDRATSLYEEGLTLVEIGVILGVTGESVRGMVRRNSGIDNSVRTASHYRERRYQRFVSLHGDAINRAFSEKRSMPEVISLFPDLRVTDVKRFLEPKANVVIQTRSSNMHWTEDRIVAMLNVAAGGRDSLSTGAYDKWRDSGVLYEGKTPPTKLVICWRFGSWNEAIRRAGLTATTSKRRIYTRSWTRDDAMGAVRTYVSEMLHDGKRPTSAGYEKWSPTKDGLPCRATLSYASGGMKWSDMLRETYASMDSDS